ncbi:hypothetical protein SBV1_710028 [Verrucomicrobia bacterium]|nr:hypothetical protein SBV1_710028 [Verrucomicrobiota bacterium]
MLAATAGFGSGGVRLGVGLGLAIGSLFDWETKVFIGSCRVVQPLI